MTDLVADRPWATRLLAENLRQPDQRSCGAASLVVARALRDERYAEMLVAGRHPTTGWTLLGAPERRFASEVLAMHARVTGPVDVWGRLQLPWPTFLGTPPWAVAHQLSSPSLRWHWRLALDGLPADAIRAALARGLPVPAYVGTRWSPRHVVLVVDSDADGGLSVYDPATGRVVAVPADRLGQGSLPFGRWDHGWFAVLPAGHLTGVSRSRGARPLEGQLPRAAATSSSRRSRGPGSLSCSQWSVIARCSSQ